MSGFTARITHELPDFADEITSLCARIYQQKNEVYHDPALLSATAKTLLQGVYDGYGQDFVSVDWDTPDHVMLTRLSQNVFSFSAAKNYQELRTITDALRDADGKLRTFSDFKEQVATINQKFNAVWLETEYDTSIATATQSARWQEFKAQKAMFPFLQYQTAGDDSVRDEHRLLDGVTKRFDDPFWLTYYPPNGWRCRCEVIQLPDDNARETPEGAFERPVVSPMFRTNVGETGLIFPQGHPYYKGVPGAEIRKAIAYLPPENAYLDLHMQAEGRSVPVRQHVMHGIEELPGNLEVLADLVRLKPEIVEARLLPEIHAKDARLKDKFYPDGWTFPDKDKNADALLRFKNKEEWVADFKRLQGNGKHLAPHLEKAAQQADYAVIKLSDKQEYGIDYIRRSVENKLKSTGLRGVIVIDSQGKLMYEQYKNTTAH